MKVKLPNLDNLRIVYYPSAVLKQVSDEVTAFDQDLKALADKMLQLMREVEGVGLAAPQVDVSIRMFVCNFTGEPEDDRVMVNPRFLELTGSDEQEEGCLSLPGVTVTMRRAKRVVVEARDLRGNRIQLTGEDIQARVWQHEVDHLDGRLIIDRMSPSDEITNRRVLKQLREDGLARRA